MTDRLYAVFAWLCLAFTVICFTQDELKHFTALANDTIIVVSAPA